MKYLKGSKWISSNNGHWVLTERTPGKNDCIDYVNLRNSQGRTIRVNTQILRRDYEIRRTET